jgi:predicted nuclease of predicted toxin-antitoxin system
VGSAAAPDSEILDYAAENGLTVFTHDLDFGNLLAHRSAQGPSVVQVRAQAVLPADVGETVVIARRMSEAQLETGALLTVDPDRNRIRLLPIR